MKFMKSLFILLIGMISLTVLGSTTHQEQKKKPVFAVEQSFQVNAVNVDNTFLVAEIRQDSQSNITLFNKEKPKLNYEAILDVGWEFPKGYSYISHYKEKLNSAYKYCADPDNKKRTRSDC